MLQRERRFLAPIAEVSVRKVRPCGSTDGLFVAAGLVGGSCWSRRSGAGHDGGLVGFCCGVLMVQLCQHFGEVGQSAGLSLMSGAELHGKAALVSD